MTQAIMTTPTTEIDTKRKEKKKLHLQSSRVSSQVIAENNAPHAGLAGAALAHQEHLLLLDLFQANGLLAGG